MLLATALSSFAQIDVVNEGTLVIADSQLVSIDGNFYNYSPDFRNSGEIGLTGNFWNEAKVQNTGFGTFRFLGNDQQIISLFDTLEVFSLEIDNPYGLLFSGTYNLRVFNHVNFYDGVLYTNEESMLEFQEQATYDYASNFSYIDGPVAKFGTTDFMFPVGKNDLLRPAGMTELFDTSLITMQYFDEDFFPDQKEEGLGKVNDREFWEVLQFRGNSTPKLLLSYSTDSNIFEEPEQIEIAHFSEADDFWVGVPSIAVSPPPNSLILTEEAISHFGYFTTTLPVASIDISSINAQQGEECEILVSWVISNDLEYDEFFIEYSYDSLSFTELDRVSKDPDIQGDVQELKYIDDQLHESLVIYYRIRIQLDAENAFYSDVVRIDNECAFLDCTIFPNPLDQNENLKLSMSSNKEMEITARIYSVLGRRLYKQKLEIKEGNHIYEINTKRLRLPCGPYFLKLKPRKSFKFVVVKK